MNTFIDLFILACDYSMSSVFTIRSSDPKGKVTYSHRVSSVVFRRALAFPLKAYSPQTPERIATIFDLKHHWKRPIIFYIIEVGAIPGARGSIPPARLHILQPYLVWNTLAEVDHILLIWGWCDARSRWGGAQ